MNDAIEEIKQFKNDFIKYVYKKSDYLFDVSRSDIYRVTSTLDNMIDRLEQEEQLMKEMRQFAEARAKRVANEVK